ncbi:hypothetical protein CK489_28445 [Bradyrhizobium sp. UFLA03-84]|nr:hypothetical protein CK489_28445 [Bradyrhizobium sp. UFLA03-84]
MEKKRRNRVRQTTSLSFMLSQLAQSARARAAAVSPGLDRESLLRKAHEADRAMEMEHLVTTPGIDLPR